MTLFASTAGAAEFSVQSTLFKVYGYDTLKQGEVELSYWSAYVASSGNVLLWKEGERVQREGLFAHTLEVEYGVTDRWTVSAYGDFEDPRGKGLDYVGIRGVISRYRLFDRGERPLDAAIYLEYLVPDHRFDSGDELEAKLILEKNLYPVFLILNPTFEKRLSGPEVDEGIEFKYALGAYAAILSSLTAGLEFFGGLGEIDHFRPLREQEHYIFPAVRTILIPGLFADIGLGFGLTDASDDLIVKGIFSYEP
jgi:hypothetical protein